MRAYVLAAAGLLAACGSKEAEAPATKVEAKRPKIVHFYANSPVLPKGETLTICYGTENVQTVKMSPYDDELEPSLNRCIAANPVKDTRYTLSVSGPGGEATESLTVRIGPPQPKQASAAASQRQLIQSFQYLGKPTAERGTPVQLCYTTVDGTASVSVEPRVQGALRPGRNECFQVVAQRTTNYVLTAKAADGVTDRMQVTIPVQ